MQPCTHEKRLPGSRRRYNGEGRMPERQRPRPHRGRGRQLNAPGQRFRRLATGRVWQRARHPFGRRCSSAETTKPQAGHVRHLGWGCDCSSPSSRPPTSRPKTTPSPNHPGSARQGWGKTICVFASLPCLDYP